MRTCQTCALLHLSHTGLQDRVFLIEVCCLVLQVSFEDAVLVTAAAVAANLFESYLGAAVQGRVSWLNNDVVNAIQISVAALLAVAARQFLI